MNWNTFLCIGNKTSNQYNCIVLNSNPLYTAITESSASHTPKIFNVKHKANIYIKVPKVINNNYTGNYKHNPPAVKEWFNSVYTFNKSTIKTLPCSDKNVYKLIKNYFDLYSVKLDNKLKSKRLRARAKRLSTNKLLVSKPDLKHTNDRINVTAYTYDRRKIYYTNKINRALTLDRIKVTKNNEHFLSLFKNLKGKSLLIWPKIENRAKTLLKKTTLSKHISLYKHFGNIYLKSYVSKYMRKEIISIRYKQSVSFEESKYGKQYLLPLVGLLERVYNKKITFNIVNLRYFYNCSNIFSQALIAKLINRVNKPTRVLKASLNTFTLPPTDRLAVYNEMYNKKKLVQNLNIDNMVLNNHNAMSDQLYGGDILEKSLLNLNNGNNLPIAEKSITNLYEIVKLVKHKFTNGVRIEIAGRLTKRNTAERSVFKLRHKGNIKNMDSSHKGLSTILLRGHAKSNLSYNQFKSKLRIGSFGLKTWISSS